MIRPDERASLFAPIDILIDGKSRQGSILLLEDRAIIAWVVGLRMKGHAESVPFDTIQEVTELTKPASTFSVALPRLRIRAERTWTIEFSNVFEGGTNIVPIIEGTLTGAVTYSWAGDPDDPQDP